MTTETPAAPATLIAPANSSAPDGGLHVPADPSIWYGDSAALREFLLAHYPMDEQRQRIVTDSLAYLDQFYATRQTENVNGDTIPVTNSPIRMASAVAVRARSSGSARTSGSRMCCHMSMKAQ